MDNMRTNAAPAKNVISPAGLASKLRSSDQSVVLDVRTPGEYKNGHIAGAKLVPLGDLDPSNFLKKDAQNADCVYVICQSGSRARKAIEAFERANYSRCVLLEGGMDAWERAGFTTVREAGAGLPLMRQVQIVVGAVNLTGSLLALFANSLFAILPLITACGLLLAGLTGWCGLAFLLAKMPWNRLSANCSTGGNCDANRRDRP